MVPPVGLLQWCCSLEKLGIKGKRTGIALFHISLTMWDIRYANMNRKVKIKSNYIAGMIAPERRGSPVIGR